MKKLVFSILLVGLISAQLSAQREKRFIDYIKIVKIPTQVLNTDINTYNTEILSSCHHTIKELGLSVDQLESQITLDGFTKLKGETEVNVVFYFGGFGNMDPVVLTVTDKDGKVKYYTSYQYSIPMTYSVYVNSEKLYSKNVAILEDGSNTKEPFTFKGSSFSSISAAKTDFYNGKGRAKLISTINGQFSKKYKIFLNQLQTEVGYYRTKEIVSTYYFKTTKKTDFMAFETKAKEFGDALKSLDYKDDRTGLITKVQPQIDFWKTEMAKVDPEDKKQNDIYRLCALNLSLAYYWLDDLVNAEKHLVLSENVKGQFLVKNALRHDIDNRKKSLAEVKEAGIDPYIGLEPASQEEVDRILEDARIKEEEEIARAAALQAKIDAEVAKYEPQIEEKVGFIIDRNNEKVSGVYKIYGRNTGTKEGLTYFIKDGEADERLLAVSFMQSGEYNETKFATVQHFGLGTLNEASIMKVLFESEKISVYKYSYLLSTADNSYSDIFFLKPDDKKAKNTSNLSFVTAYKARMASFFEDCPTLVEKIKAGEYPASDAMRVAIAKDYSTMCK